MPLPLGKYNVTTWEILSVITLRPLAMVLRKIPYYSQNKARKNCYNDSRFPDKMINDLPCPPIAFCNITFAMDPNVRGVQDSPPPFHIPSNEC